MEQWPRDGVPANPRAWLDFDRPLQGHRRHAPPRPVRSPAGGRSPSALDPAPPNDHREQDREDIEDDRLRLIFTCCHPALAPEARVALTLREVCGLTTEEIAHAFLTSPATLAQRIVRAKAKIRDDAHPLPGAVARRAARTAGGGAPGDLPGVQRGLFRLVGRVADPPRPLGRGHPPGAAAGRAAAGAGGDGAAGADAAARIAPRRAHLAGRATWFCWRTRTARSGTGNRSRKGRRWWSRRWHRAGLARTPSRRPLRRCTPRRPASPRRTGRRSSACMTCWRRCAPSPVVEINRAVAVAMRDGPAAGLAADRRHPGARRPGRLSPGARGASRAVPAAGKNGGSPRLLPAGAGPYPAGAGAALSRAPAARPAGIQSPGCEITL